MINPHFLPAELPAERIVACIGLMTMLDLLNEIKKEPAIPDAVMVQFEYTLSTK